MTIGQELYEAWAWLVKEEDGREGLLAVTIAEGNPWFATLGPVLTLQSREREVAAMMKMYADMHTHSTGAPTRLAHLREVLE